MQWNGFCAWGRSKVTQCIVMGIINLVPLFGSAQGQSSVQTEENFRDVFLTAAYSAAFGAAFGAALLPFFPGAPQDNLRYVTGGASVGFMAGSAFAFYNLARMQQNHLAPAEDQPYYGNKKPVGALFVGRNSDFGVSFPAIAAGRGAYGMRLVRYEY